MEPLTLEHHPSTFDNSANWIAQNTQTRGYSFGIFKKNIPELPVFPPHTDNIHQPSIMHCPLLSISHPLPISVFVKAGSASCPF